ncbi:MAG: hypothetical protein OXF78_07275, partial [Rhodospirillales bacterium]|nr:hypothetical protein [Rhodospirillales bacterium]
LADCFLVPQVRNALLAGIDLPGEFPTLSRVWENAIAVPEAAAVLNEAGGIVQPFAFDAEKFEVYADVRDANSPPHVTTPDTALENSASDTNTSGIAATENPGI